MNDNIVPLPKGHTFTDELSDKNVIYICSSCGIKIYFDTRRNNKKWFLLDGLEEDDVPNCSEYKMRQALG